MKTKSYRWKVSEGSGWMLRASLRLGLLTSSLCFTVLLWAVGMMGGPCHDWHLPHRLCDNGCWCACVQEGNQECRLPAFCHPVHHGRGISQELPYSGSEHHKEQWKSPSWLISLFSLQEKEIAIPGRQKPGGGGGGGKYLCVMPNMLALKIPLLSLLNAIPRCRVAEVRAFCVEKTTSEAALAFPVAPESHCPMCFS